MPILHLDLRDGFKNDVVTVLFDGKEAVRLTDVTTDPAISHAATQDISAPEGSCRMQIDIPNRGLSAHVELDASDTPFITVFAHEGHIETRKFKQAVPLM